jgi:hypothetical protein
MVKLSSNFSSGFTFDESINRMYIASGMGNRVYMFDLPATPAASAAPAAPAKK